MLEVFGLVDLRTIKILIFNRFIKLVFTIYGGDIKAKQLEIVFFFYAWIDSF
jgi:hypothetical protein